jgi:hypothetical protein
MWMMMIKIELVRRRRMTKNNGVDEFWRSSKCNIPDGDDIVGDPT